MDKWLMKLSIFLLGVTFLIGCGKQLKAVDSHKIQIYTSIYPLEEFSKKVGGPYVEVTNLTPLGVEPHDFELTAQDLRRLSDADMLIYNGAGLEGWVDKAIPLIDQKQTAIVNTTKGLDLLKSEQSLDPHVWLDPLIAKDQALKIKEALVKIDPEHKKVYEKNYQTLSQQFDSLDREYSEMVKNSSIKEFVTSHAAFAYLGQRYGLKQIAVSGISPEHEPSPKELKVLTEKLQRLDIKVIFFETLVKSKISEVLRKEIDAQALILNPLEGLTLEELSHKEDYFSIMRKNKNNLTKALGEKR